MLEIQRINTSDREYYEYMENLLTASFPPEEYRELSELKRYTDTLPRFYNNIILYDKKPIGLITWWDFDDFYYIEHFAIDPNHRNGGYGRKLMEHVSALLNRPIVLEVELPHEEMAERRIDFYKRQGFTLWEKEYIQPPYKAGYDGIPMYLMVLGSLDSNRDFDTVGLRIHRDVYHVIS